MPDTRLEMTKSEERVSCGSQETHLPIFPQVTTPPMLSIGFSLKISK